MTDRIEARRDILNISSLRELSYQPGTLLWSHREPCFCLCPWQIVAAWPDNVETTSGKSESLNCHRISSATKFFKTQTTGIMSNNQSWPWLQWVGLLSTVSAISEIKNVAGWFVLSCHNSFRVCRHAAIVQLPNWLALLWCWKSSPHSPLFPGSIHGYIMSTTVSARASRSCH